MTMNNADHGGITSIGTADRSDVDQLHAKIDNMLVISKLPRSRIEGLKLGWIRAFAVGGMIPGTNIFKQNSVTQGNSSLFEGCIELGWHAPSGVASIGSQLVLHDSTEDRDLLFANRVEVLSWLSRATYSSITEVLLEIELRAHPLEQLAKTAEESDQIG